MLLIRFDRAVNAGRAHVSVFGTHRVRLVLGCTRVGIGRGIGIGSDPAAVAGAITGDSVFIGGPKPRSESE